MPNPKTNLLFTHMDDLSFAPKRHRVTCEDWGVLAEKSHFKDWPDFRQTARDCDEWADATCRQIVDRAHEFNDLVKTWQQDTMFMSSVTQMAIHPSYQRIIGMGQPVVPLILKELSENPSHWFWALEAISGENPAENATTFDEGVQDWLNWGRAKGHIR